jgi:uncharacterized protein (TIGR00730 family)
MPQDAPKLSICLYCGSSNATRPSYLEAAAIFGRTLAAEGVRLVYGGGGVGLMGAAARAVHDAGAFLRSAEVVYDAVETLVVDNMHRRKQLMFEASDAFAVFPGGIGTLEEVVELMSWRRLDLHAKPIVFVDIDGFWQPYFALVEHMVREKLAPDWLMDVMIQVASVDEVLPAVRKALANAPTHKANQVFDRA